MIRAWKSLWNARYFEIKATEIAVTVSTAYSKQTMQRQQLAVQGVEQMMGKVGNMQTVLFSL